MTTRRNTSSELPNQEVGEQRESNFQKVIKMLPVRSKDNFMLLVLLVMGLSGFAYIVSVPFGTKVNKRSLLDKIFYPEQNKSLTADFIKSNLLKIDGVKNANMPLVFNFNNLSEDHDYIINFGDEINAPIESGVLEHTYDTSGTYKIEMKKISRGHTFVVHCEYISIK